MEADWSAEVGAGLPTIAVPWPGFIDLTGLSTDQVAQRVSEAAGLPAFSETLALLNAAGSPVTTAKCDVWPLGADEIDIYEFDTTRADALLGHGSYIDVLPHALTVFLSFELTETWARNIARTLAVVSIAQARAEVVVRAARLHSLSGYALTLYAFGCGGDHPAAVNAWAAALAAAAAATMATIPTPGE